MHRLRRVEVGEGDAPVRQGGQKGALVATFFVVVQVPPEYTAVSISPMLAPAMAATMVEEPATRTAVMAGALPPAMPGPAEPVMVLRVPHVPPVRST